MALNTHSLNLVSSSSQYAHITDAAQSGLDLTGSLTIEGWFYFADNSIDAGLVSRWQGGAPSNNAFEFNYTGSSTDRLGFIYSSNGTYQPANEKYVNFSPNNNQWYHIAVVVDLSVPSVKFYVNGVLIGSHTTTNTSIHNSTRDFYIGRSGDGRYFGGKMNNVRIWSDARTEQEIRENMFADLTPGLDNLVEVWTFNNTLNSKTGNNNLTGVNSPTFNTDIPFPQYAEINPVALGNTTLAEDPISYWGLDGNSNDSNGSNNGTDTSITYSTGKFGNGAVFNGTTSMINVGTDNSLNLTSALTIAAWIYPTGWGENNFGRIFQRHVGSTGYMLYLSSSISGITFNAGGDISSQQSIELNKWQFVVATLSGGTAKIYINGILVTQASGTISGASGEAGYIGNRSNNSGDRTFDGILDDVAIFDRALTATEIFELYTGLNALVTSNIKYFNGSEWVDGMKKVFDGSVWHDATINTF